MAMATIPADPVVLVSIGLFTILALVLILPFKFKLVEQNLEAFFLIMGIVAMTIAGLWSIDVIQEALLAPVMIGGIPLGIFQIVLIAGLAIHYFNKQFYSAVFRLSRKLGPPLFIFIIISVLALVSSIISVIVAAVILTEIVVACPYERKDKINLTIVTCFALGLGAALTPLGEPLSTIAISKLSGEPYFADFFFLFDLLGVYIIIGVLALAAFGALWIGRKISKSSKNKSSSDRSSKDNDDKGTEEVTICELPEYTEKLKNVVLRAVKVYIFVAALILLGTGLSPLIIWYFTQIPPYGLYWVNITSAVVDNATLTAAEIGPSLSLLQIKSALLGLLIAGGMLIPGNIPNIVAAARLKITAKEWARIGLILGMVLMVIYFLWLLPEFI
jgi:predicted cation transporter